MKGDTHTVLQCRTVVAKAEGAGATLQQDAEAAGGGEKQQGEEDDEEGDEEGEESEEGDEEQEATAVSLAAAVGAAALYAHPFFAGLRSGTRGTRCSHGTQTNEHLPPQLRGPAPAARAAPADGAAAVRAYL